MSQHKENMTNTKENINVSQLCSETIRLLIRRFVMKSTANATQKHQERVSQVTKHVTNDVRHAAGGKMPQ